MLYEARKKFLTVRLGRTNCSEEGITGKSLLKSNFQKLLSIRIEGDLKYLGDVSAAISKTDTDLF